MITAEPVPEMPEPDADAEPDIDADPDPGPDGEPDPGPDADPDVAPDGCAAAIALANKPINGMPRESPIL